MFWTGRPAEAALHLPDPQEFELSLPADQAPEMTQGGFFVPLSAPDDIEGSVQVSWDALSTPEFQALSALRPPNVLSFDDPFELNMRGYIKSLDYQTVAGRTGTDGGPMYATQLVLQLTSLRWPDVVGMPVPDREYAVGERFGVSASGQLPAQITGAHAVQTDADGWLELIGGDTEPWGPVVPPVTGDEWPRPLRTRITPLHGVQSRFVALDGTQLSPTRGSVFLAFRPLSTESTL